MELKNFNSVFWPEIVNSNEWLKYEKNSFFRVDESKIFQTPRKNMSVIQFDSDFDSFWFTIHFDSWFNLILFILNQNFWYGLILFRRESRFTRESWFTCESKIQGRWIVIHSIANNWLIRFRIKSESKWIANQTGPSPVDDVNLTLNIKITKLSFFLNLHLTDSLA